MSNKIGYFQVKTKNGTGYICVAMDRPPKDTTTLHTAAFSFCSPKDSFDKAMARKIAEGRLAITRHYFVSFNFIGPTKDAMKMALRCASETNMLPSWVRKPLESGNILFGLTDAEKQDTSWEFINSKDKKPEVFSL